jgi:integrase
MPIPEPVRPHRKPTNPALPPERPPVPPARRLHDARHTAATQMLDSGTTISAAAKWLGRDPAMTLRVYGHVYDDALASAGNVLLGGIPSTGATMP